MAVATEKNNPGVRILQALFPKTDNFRIIISWVILDSQNKTERNGNVFNAEPIISHEPVRVKRTLWFRDGRIQGHVICIMAEGGSSTKALRLISLNSVQCWLRPCRCRFNQTPLVHGADSRNLWYFDSECQQILLSLFLLPECAFSLPPSFSLSLIYLWSLILLLSCLSLIMFYFVQCLYCFDLKHVTSDLMASRIFFCLLFFPFSGLVLFHNFISVQMYHLFSWLFCLALSFTVKS